ncbi:MAG: 3-methylornithine--L-lysine ligase [Candidatus Methanogaster sp.]|nr:MAG: 3-methylornithine--L-lysine ligase [ANME-2 cluster archaeon]
MFLVHSAVIFLARKNMKLLIVGYSTRYVVCAGKRAGYTVYSLDHFGDSDLLGCADKYACFDEIANDDELLSVLDRLDWDFDAIILGTGFEYADLGREGYRVLNNPPDIARSTGNKKSFAEKMGSFGLPHPRIYDIDDDFGYPVMLKPVYGVGGIENRLAYSKEEIRGCGNDLLIQEYIEGIPASVSVIATHKDAVAIAVNEQLIGTRWLSAHRFAYSGNVTPFRSEYDCEMREIAVQVVKRLGLVGSNGVDFLITDSGPVTIEVNARFQGTLDTVEHVSGISVFDAHVKAFSGELPEIDPDNDSGTGFAGKAIVFTDYDLVIDKTISKRLVREPIRDIPVIGCKIPAGDPVTTVFCTGRTREQVLDGLKTAAWRIRRLVGDGEGMVQL